MHFAGQWAKGSADAIRIAGNPGGGDHEALAGTQRYGRAACQRARADFRSLQVGDDGDGFLVLDGSGTECRDAARVVGVGTVREIQARYVHACVHQSFNDAWGRTGRADGADNF